ncbi:MAG: hypothetical protein JO322_07865 [Candidatus Eremiobacteraeota bacterium]|nr:hypothetical protein [Candidatus Eremiobacteraeota bacterium]
MESLARAATGLILAAATVAAPVQLNGTFALLGGTQRIVARAIVSHPRPNEVTFDIKQTSQQGGIVRSYQIDMTKLMHLVVISDDFRQFSHEHPSYNRKSGTFRQTITVDPSHAYIVYADSTPKSAGQQVFRFSIPASANPSATMAPLPPSTPSPDAVTAGPYAVKLGTTTLAARTAQMIPLEITKAGAAAMDLEPYLGAAGHAVFVNTATLEYVHVHPMVRSTMSTTSPMSSGSMDMDQPQSGPVAGPHLMMHVPPLPVGTYKLWFQFRGAGSLEVASFTLAVR